RGGQFNPALGGQFHRFFHLATYRKLRDIVLLRTVTKSTRGTRSERDLVLKLLKAGIPAQTIFHDLYVKNFNGGFSQIDLVVATKVGVIVFEVKDYKGWLFGDVDQTEWTQVLAHGRSKYRFYNPIMQNRKHLVDLRKQLKQFEKIPFYSIVVFYGNCVLNDFRFMSNGSYLVKAARVMEILNVIMSNNDPAPYTDKHEVIRVLKEAVHNGANEAIRIQHLENIKEMLGNK
ncbi:MAG TPA: nuclease-related domain-containing protein, partial [Bacteroidales bacterium]|nr:nuclease-related domain-containing protein [Bacteroidales bacterium]